jgi:hypothetical protein
MKPIEMGFRQVEPRTQLFGKDLFGYWLPFIGFEDMAIDKKTFEEWRGEKLDQDEVRGTFFTIEWLGRGVSLGQFEVPTDGDG